jgi:GNAT superfamily N-acetyltransferase
VPLRLLRREDRAALEALLHSTEIFTPDEIAVALELIDIGIAEGPASGYHFRVVDVQGDVGGYVCYGPAPLSDGAWDVYWIVVAPASQGGGIGGALLATVEDAAARGGGRMVLIETSSQQSYDATRRFYERNGYAEIARVPDFYSVGDDKIVFCKGLAFAP